jgi:hypothetical protein
MTRDLDLLKIDFYVIANIVRLRGASAPSEAKGEEQCNGEEPEGSG